MNYAKQKQSAGTITTQLQCTAAVVNDVTCSHIQGRIKSSKQIRLPNIINPLFLSYSKEIPKVTYIS